MKKRLEVLSLTIVLIIVCVTLGLMFSSCRSVPISEDPGRIKDTVKALSELAVLNVLVKNPDLQNDFCEYSRLGIGSLNSEISNGEVINMLDGLILSSVPEEDRLILRNCLVMAHLLFNIPDNFSLLLDDNKKELVLAFFEGIEKGSCLK